MQSKSLLICLILMLLVSCAGDRETTREHPTALETARNALTLPPGTKDTGRTKEGEYPYPQDWTLQGDSDGARAGYALALEDLNGDGWEDLIVGEPGYSNGENEEGRIQVFYGKSWGLSDEPGWTWESNVENAQCGFSVAGAGDMDADGYKELVVGCPAADRVYIFRGSVTGVQAAGYVSPGYVSLNEPSEFGYSVAGAGDVDGDGYGDIVIGAPSFLLEMPVETYGNGLVTVHFGQDVLPPSRSESQTSISSTNPINSRFGHSVAGGADVNADGYDDIIIGEPHYTNGLSLNSGRVHVLMGSESGLLTSWWINSWFAAEDALWGTKVAMHTDSNNDGYGDFAISAPGLDWYLYWVFPYPGFIYEFTGGAVYPQGTSGILGGYDADACREFVYVDNIDGSGKVGILTNYFFDTDPEDETVVALFPHNDQSWEEYPPDWTVAGPTSDGFGDTFASGDINGDRVSDIFIGAPYQSETKADEGAVYAYYGTPLNNVCEQATEITFFPTIIYSNTSGAKPDYEPDPGSCGDRPEAGQGRERVYKIAASSEAATYLIALEGDSDAEYTHDTTLHIRQVNEGADCATAVQTACSDDLDDGVNQSRILLDATLGKDYYIFADGSGEDNPGGGFHLAVSKWDCDGCVIDSACHEDGEANPEDLCKSCQTSVSRVQWTAVQCDDNGLFCDGAESCDSATGQCESSGDPCGEDETCDEEKDECDPAAADDDDDDDATDDDDDDDDTDGGDDDATDDDAAAGGKSGDDDDDGACG